MSRDAHEQARELMALGEGLPEAQQARLRIHLEECEACRNYAEAAREAVRALRSLSLTADARLVRATQMRVRFHAGRLRETRERTWLVGIACLTVGISAALTAPLVWRLFAWVGEMAGVSNPVWQVGFALFWIAPTVAASALFLVHGAHGIGNSDVFRE